MPTTTIRTPPSDADFTPLSEYEAQTPDTFFDGKPVLHFRASGAKCWIPRSQCGSLPVFPADSASTSPSGPEGQAASAGEELTEQKLDVWVSSQDFTLFNQEAQVGVTIPYPSISIHALKSIGPEEKRVHTIWMQLELGDSGGDDGDDDFNTLELTLIPPPAPTDASATTTATATTPQSEAKKLFEAVSECSNLHPDPANEGGEDEDDEDRIVFEGGAGYEALEGFTGVIRGSADGGLPPPVPGSSGWITAENVHEYFDADGNWIGEGDEGVSGELGDGAGRVRSREESGSEAVNGAGNDEDSENKRPRVE